MRFSSFLLAVFFSVVAADDGPTINCGSTALSSVISDSDFSKLKVAESILPGMHDTLCGGPNPVANDICSNEFVCTMTAGLHPLTKSNLVQIVYNMTIDPVAPGQPFQGSDSSKCGTVMSDIASQCIQGKKVSSGTADFLNITYSITFSSVTIDPIDTDGIVFGLDSLLTDDQIASIIASDLPQAPIGTPPPTSTSSAPAACTTLPNNFFPICSSCDGVNGACTSPGLAGSCCAGSG